MNDQVMYVIRQQNGNTHDKDGCVRLYENRNDAARQTRSGQSIDTVLVTIRELTN